MALRIASRSTDRSLIFAKTPRPRREHFAPVERVLVNLHRMEVRDEEIDTIRAIARTLPSHVRTYTRSSRSFLGEERGVARCLAPVGVCDLTIRRVRGEEETRSVVMMKHHRDCLYGYEYGFLPIAAIHRRASAIRRIVRLYRLIPADVGAAEDCPKVSLQCSGWLWRSPSSLERSPSLQRSCSKVQRWVYRRLPLSSGACRFTLSRETTLALELQPTTT